MHLGVIVQQLSLHRPQTPAAFVEAASRYTFTGAARDTDITNFLNRAAASCTAHSSMARAITRLDGLRSLQRSGAFPHLNVRQIIYQLALRVLTPKIINQRGYGMCGPVAFMITALDSNPISVIELACNLLIRGRGRFGNMQVVPDLSIRQFDCGANIEHADWLLLASLRNQRINNGELSEAGQYGGSTILEMFDWLKSSGYPSIVCLPSDNALSEGIMRTIVPSVAMTKYHPRKPSFLSQLWSSSMTSPRGNLNLARAFLDNGWRVLFCVTETYAGSLGDTDPVEARVNAVRLAYQSMEMEAPVANMEQARQAAITNLVGNSTNHWVIVSDITVANGKVRITRYSWGGVAQTVPVDTEVFLRIYGGFVALHLAPMHAAEAGWQAPNYL